MRLTIGEIEGYIENNTRIHLHEEFTGYTKPIMIVGQLSQNQKQPRGNFLAIIAIRSEPIWMGTTDRELQMGAPGGTVRQQATVRRLYYLKIFV